MLCPKCGSEISPDATECWMCLRRRSRKQIFAGYRNLRSVNKPKLSRTVKALLLIGAVAAAARIAVWKISGPAPESAPTEASRPPPAPTEASRPPPVPVPVPAQETGDPGKDHHKYYALRPPDKKIIWTVHGTAYDLVDLAPIAGAKIVFSDKSSGKAFTVSSGKDGRFSIELKPVADGGYAVSVSHRRYASSYLEDMDPSYLTQSAHRREDALGLFFTSRILHVPIQLIRVENKRRYDVFLAPAE